MTTRKPTDEPPKVSFVVTSTGTLIVVRPRYLFRFLLADGETLDVISDRDDSDVRAALFKHSAQAIVGVARVGFVIIEEQPTNQPTESNDQP
jgi:hypothetical protein